MTYTRDHREAYWAEVHAQAARDQHQAGSVHDTSACGFAHDRIVTCSGCGYVWSVPGHGAVGASLCSVCAESRQAAADVLALLEMPELMIERVLGAARAQGEVMTILEYGNARVEYRAGVYTVTP